MGGAAPLKLGRGTVFKLNLATHKLTLIYTFSGLSMEPVLEELS